MLYNIFTLQTQIRDKITDLASKLHLHVCLMLLKMPRLDCRKEGSFSITTDSLAITYSLSCFVLSTSICFCQLNFVPRYAIKELIFILVEPHLLFTNWHHKALVDKISSIVWHLTSNVEHITCPVRRASYATKSKRDFSAQIFQE